MRCINELMMMFDLLGLTALGSAELEFPLQGLSMKPQAEIPRFGRGYQVIEAIDMK